MCQRGFVVSDGVGKDGRAPIRFTAFPVSSRWRNIFVAVGGAFGLISKETNHYPLVCL
jgi:hypothetical protein